MENRRPLGQPDNVRELRGNPGKRSTKPTPEAIHEVPNAPTWLSREGAAEWRRVAPELRRLNIISSLDRAILSSYVETWAVMVAARKEIGSSPIIDCKRTKEPIKSPAWTVYVQAVKLMTKPCSRAGPYSLQPRPHGRADRPGSRRR